MRKALAGLGALVGLVVALIGIAAKFSPIDTIIGSYSWLGFLARLKDITPYWLIITIVGGVIAIGFGLMFITAPRSSESTQIAEPAPVPLGQMYRADNLDIRTRVKDLLHRAWGGPLIALIIGAIPLAVGHAGIHIFMRPFQMLSSVLSAPFIAFFQEMGDLRVGLILIASGTFPDFSAVPNELMSCMSGLAVLIILGLLIFGPMRVSRADYFTRLLYGRKPSPLSVYGCFSKLYPRALGGMAYHSVWLTVWGVLALAGPPALYLGGMELINRYPEYTTSHIMTLMPTLVIATIVAFVALMIRFINRWLAYSLAPCILATQKHLSARRAMRASRWLMRGKKMRLLGMWLSFLYYLLPSVCAAILLPLVGLMATTFSFTEYLTQSLRQFFIIVIALNQVLLIYVAPVAYASFYAFYLEMKRDFKENHPLLPFILTTPKKSTDLTKDDLEAMELLKPSKSPKSPAPTRTIDPEDQATGS